MKKVLLLFTMLLLGFTLTGCIVEPPGPVIYTVTFNANAEEVTVAFITVEEGKTVQEPTTPTREGYGFAGWFSDSNLNVAYDFSQPVVGDMTLHAKWTDTTFTITFMVDGGTSIDSFEFDINDTLTLPTTTKDGYEFDGWYSDNTFTTPFNGETPNSDVTLYAKWVLSSYLLTIYDMEGNVVTSVAVNYGDILPDVDLSSIGDFAVIDGVYLDSGLTTPNTNITMPSQDLDLYLEYHIEQPTSLHIAFVPNRDAAEILEVTDPLRNLLKDELETQGILVDEVTLSVGSSYEAVAEMIDTGSADIAYLPASFYSMYDMASDNFNLLLVATRTANFPVSMNLADWNTGSSTLGDYGEVAHYYSLLIAGPSAAGQGVRSAIEGGYELTWEAISNLTWCVRSATSSSGYTYPNAWLMEHYGKTFDDMPSQNVIQTSGYGQSMASLAFETCDVATFYSDARVNYDSNWISEYGRTESIWTETYVIGVSHPIMNDVIVTSRLTVDDTMHAALQTAFINLAETPEGLDVFSIYSHKGYAIIDTSFFDYMKQYIINQG